MFDIGFSELLMVGIVALLVLGPEKLPVAARTCGLWVGRLRRSITNIQREISEELKVEELRRTTAIQKEALDQELAEMRQPFASGSEREAVEPAESAGAAVERGSDAMNADAESSEKKPDTP